MQAEEKVLKLMIVREHKRLAAKVDQVLPQAAAVDALNAAGTETQNAEGMDLTVSGPSLPLTLGGIQSQGMDAATLHTRDGRAEEAEEHVNPDIEVEEF